MKNSRRSAIALVALGLATGCGDDGVTAYALDHDAQVDAPSDVSSAGSSAMDTGARDSSQDGTLHEAASDVSVKSSPDASTDARQDSTSDARDAPADTGNEVNLIAPILDASGDSDAGPNGDASDAAADGDASPNPEAGPLVHWEIGSSMTCQVPAVEVTCGPSDLPPHDYAVRVDTLDPSCNMGSAGIVIQFAPGNPPAAGDYQVVVAPDTGPVPAGKVAIDLEATGKWHGTGGTVNVTRPGGGLVLGFSDLSVSGSSDTTATGVFSCPSSP